MMEINSALFDKYKTLSVDEAMSVIPELQKLILMARYDGIVKQLREGYYEFVASQTPKGTRAYLQFNMMWNMAMDAAQRAKAIVPCAKCYRKNRVLLWKWKVALCAECGNPIRDYGTQPSSV